MNNKSNELPKGVAQSATRRGTLKNFALGVSLVAWLVTHPVFLSAADAPIGSPVGIAVTGNSDWSIVPANLTPQFVFDGIDGDLYVRHLPLVGRITLAGRSVSIQGRISADFNGDLDATYSGPLWAPVTITATADGSKAVIFEGNAIGSTVGLVSTGTIKLSGRGPYEGAKLQLEFTEIGPGNTDTYTLKGTLIPASGN